VVAEAGPVPVRLTAGRTGHHPVGHAGTPQRTQVVIKQTTLGLPAHTVSSYHAS
jgi:hypothetical protein